ncbi:flagellar biosynthesis sigma factor FliA [Legionella busanensis]|uniref:RNA polymerase sigma factor FliA n=1 Tax=Legionella busanensis TaxID=190655 RepID=A0A378JUY2_9GAMM|nr:RNA polymerase sigma factor FliA [Legionella busanensis]STX52022.1 flagellar biosynthesis sigma factor FliA [Legionella busanensis]
MDALAAYGKATQIKQETFIKAYALLVKRIAHHLQAKLPHSIQLDDLIQAGMMGLLEAARHYDITKGASFETYAGIRIRGHMLDEVRRNDWVPRSVYRNARVIAMAVKTVENRLGREAKDNEVAAELNISLDEYYDMLRDAAGSQLYGFEDLGVTDDMLKSDNNGITEPHTHVIQTDLKQHLTEIIKGLPEKERLVLSLYYEQDLNLKEIGEVLEVSESRVCQIHTQAMLRIRARLTG